MDKEINYSEKLKAFNQRQVLDKKYTQHEVILDFLSRNRGKWFYVWEIMGAKPLGWLSHKTPTRVNELCHEGKVEVRYIGKYAVYSII